VALAELDGLHSPNPYGDLPLLNDDPATPNEAYFKHVDFIIDKAAEYNMVIGLLPTWGDKIWKGGWGKGPEIFNTSNAKAFGKWIANRYRSRKNIIWIMGGDRNPRNQSDVDIFSAMAEGVTEESTSKPLITFHPQPNELGSAEWFHKKDWLSFNMFQNGHCRYTPVYDKIQVVYNLQPAKPVLDGEPIYEDHPVCFDASRFGTSNSYDVRLYLWLDLFAGAFGHTYGCHDVWQMYSPYRTPVNGPHLPWQEAIELEGANQMQYARKLLEAYPMLDRIPDQSLIVENNNAQTHRIQATRGKDYLMVYSAAGQPFTLNHGKISGKKLQAYWYNPRKGTATKIEDASNSGQQKFTPPSKGYGEDWVLVLSDADKKYNNPN